MSVQKRYRLEEKALARQRAVVAELEDITKSIERCEKTICDLAVELDAVNVRHQARKSTREDIDYLTDLLSCAHKKLGWEKQIASLQKRIPALIQEVGAVMNDADHPPGDEMKASTAVALQRVQAAMQRLDQVKVA